MLTTWVSWRWGLFINVPIGIALVVLAPRYLPETERSPGHLDLRGAATSSLGMTALVYGFIRAASDGWANRTAIGSFVVGVSLLASFVATERRAEQPITPLRLFASRERSGAYATRALLVSGMFAMFFFLTQYFQGVRDYSALKAGLAFLPVTAVMFAVVRLIQRISPRIGNSRLLPAGVLIALVGMVFLSRITAGTSFFPGIALPMMLLGIGIGTAMAPLTTAGITGVDPRHAGAASGLVNVSQQLGGSLGLSILVTVFATATRSVEGQRLGATTAAQQAQRVLAHAIAASLTGSVVFLALAFAVVFVVMSRPRLPFRPPSRDTVAELEEVP
jgi:predicted MFS family arabinose efflux permease